MQTQISLSADGGHKHRHTKHVSMMMMMRCRSADDLIPLEWNKLARLITGIQPIGFDENNLRRNVQSLQEHKNNHLNVT